MSLKYLILICGVFTLVNSECKKDDEVIRELLKDYQKGQPPPKVVDVETDFWLAESEKLCEKCSCLTVNIYLNQLWTDTRLNFEKLTPCNDRMLVDDLYRLWTPDLNVINSRKFEIHKSPRENIFTLLYENGTVWTNIRTKMEVPCKIKSGHASCNIVQSSYTYSTKNVRIAVGSTGFFVIEDGSVGKWNLSNSNISVKSPVYPAGEWNEVNLKLEYTHKHPVYHLMKTHIPAFIIVLVVGLSILLGARFAVARALIIALALFLLMFLAVLYRKKIPVDSQIGMSDIFMAACILFVIVAFIHLVVCESCTQSDSYSLLNGMENEREEKRSKFCRNNCCILFFGLIFIVCFVGLTVFYLIMLDF